MATRKWLKENTTPYRFATTLSEALDREIAPQQVYGYVRSGALETGTFDSGHKMITPEVGNAFIQSRLELRAQREAKAAEAEAEAVAADDNS